MKGYTGLIITPDIDQTPWTHLRLDQIREGLMTRIGLLRHGTVKGNATVEIEVTLDDGSIVIAETTWKLYRTAFAALNASPIIAEEVMDA